jgi:multidrug resistance efflux pump
MNRWKAIPWVLVGVALLAVSLVAARLNTPPSSANAEKAAAPTPTGSVVGPTVMGYVDTAGGMLPLMPPGVPAMASLTVKKVHVKEGATVSPGDVLVEFDSSTMAEKKVQAEHAVTEAEWVADQARKKADLHPLVVEKAKIGVRKAESDLAAAEKAQKAVSDTVEENLKAATQSPTDRTPLTEEQKELRRSRSPELLQANATLAAAKIGVEAAKHELKQAESAPPLLEADVQRANAAVARQRSLVADATAVIESFKLKAQVAGVIEQISVTDGMAVGQATRTPLMYLVPAGPRVVRAEVEAEFAHKIDGFVGKTVTVFAGEKFNDTYTGTARRVSGAFLPKRFGSDALVANQTRALECVIDVTDPAPPGKPPLRPGQPVRVTFGN